MRGMIFALRLLGPCSPRRCSPETAADNYCTYCVQCHGSLGNGKGIKQGGVTINKSALMPAWGDILFDDEINDLVQHLRTLCKCNYGN